MSRYELLSAMGCSGDSNFAHISDSLHLQKLLLLISVTSIPKIWNCGEAFAKHNWWPRYCL